MNFPVIPGFTAGYGPQQTDFQGQWVSPVTFFQSRVVFRATQATTATTLPDSGAVTKIGYDNIIEDPYSGWSAANFWWVCPSGYSGWYQVTIGVYVTSPGIEEVILQAYAASAIVGNIPLAGVCIPEADSASCGSAYVYLVGGQDAIHGAAAVQNSSVNITTCLTAGAQSWMEIMWVST